MKEKDFVADYKNGLTIREIAAKYSVSYENVRKNLKGKVEWRKKYISDFSPEEIKKAIEMFDSGSLVKDIAKWFEISPPAISRLLRANNRFPVSSRKKYEILRTTPLNFIQKQVIVGHLLGDGCAYRDGPNSQYKISISHQIKHEQYFHWKIAMLDPFVNNWRKSIDKRGNSEMLHATSICHPGLKQFAEMFYDDQRIKHVPDGLEIYMTPLTLAVWVMDDGNLNAGVNLRLATHSFTQDENIKLRDLLRSVYGIRSKVMEFKYKGKLYYQITINKENTQKLSDIVRPYFVDCMRYKLMPESSEIICRTS